MRSRRGAYDSSDVDVRWQVPLRSEASHSFWADRSSQGWQSGLPACIAENFVFVHVICPWLLKAASPTATSIFLPFTNFSWVPLNQSDVAWRRRDQLREKCHTNQPHSPPIAKAITMLGFAAAAATKTPAITRKR